MKRMNKIADQLLPANHRTMSAKASGVAAAYGGVSCLTMNDGSAHPVLGYGTYKVGFIPASASGQAGQAAGKNNSDEAEVAVAAALQAGYRFVDCAQFYGNEAAVGRGLKRSGLDRKDMFIQSKAWCDTIYEGRTAIMNQVEKTLNDLQTDYLDLYLVHWPVPGKHVAAYQTLEELQKMGKIRSLGLSNYAVEDYQELMEHVTVKPTVNQIEVNPLLYRKRTLSYFQEQGVLIQAYRPLCKGQAFDHPLITQLAKTYSRTPAQILGRWSVQKGFVYMPKSSKPKRVVENAAVFDFALEAKDMGALDSLTTPQAFEAFRKLYEKCVIRDTPLEGTKEGINLIKKNVTVD